MWFPLTLLSAFLWAVINVVNSTLVAKFHKSPSFLLWVQTCFSMVFLMLIALNYSVSTDWMPLLVAAAFFAYLGDLLFLWILDRLDISVVNAAWAMNSMFLSVIGFTFFSETWTTMQFFGALLVCSGVLFVSFFHTHVSLKRTLLMLLALGLCYLPVAVVRKAAMLSGETILPVIFWLILGRDLVGFVVPFMLPRQRRNVFDHLPQCTSSFVLLSGLVVACFYATELVLTFSYRLGPVSLISIVGNIQPFFVLLLAAATAQFFPAYAPKELWSIQSTSIKILSFSVVFIGLALLTLS